MKTNHTLRGKLSAGPGDKRNPSLAIQAAGSLTLASSCFPASLSGLSGASGVLRLSPTAIYELMMLQVTIVLRCQVSSEYMDDEESCYRCASSVPSDEVNVNFTMVLPLVHALI